MDHTYWILIFGGIVAFLNAFAVGANMLANAWGAVIGAKVIKYRTAVLLGIGCQIVGVLVFGSRVASVYNGILYDWTKLKPYPGLTLYALMWTEVTLVIWQFLALWKQILIPIYLGTVASTIGAAFVFPGKECINGGTSLAVPPFLSGLGPVFITWLVGPTLALTLVILLFLILRALLMRGEDPFHKSVWAMPAIGCFVTMIWAADLIYSVGSAQGLQVLSGSSQEVVVVLAALGSAGCIGSCLYVPRMIRTLKMRSRAVIGIKRMNLLGLDEATVRDLATDERSKDMTGWLQRAHAWLFEGDIFASVASDDDLIRIHSSAEEYDAAAEECFMGIFQVITCMIITIAYAANNVRTSVGMFTLMYHIQKNNAVTATAPIGLGLRGIGAAGMCLGTLLCGFRLVPVTGAQIAKMTPFRSFVVTVMTALTLTIMALLNLKGGTITYVITAAVAAVGLAEGSSHVNWKKLRDMLVWWILGFTAVMLSTWGLVAQGMYAPSIVSDATTTH